MNRDRSSKESKKLWDYHQIVNREHLLAARSRLHFLAQRIKKSKKSGRLLDVGFGDGHLLRRLHPDFELFGVDISSKNVRRTLAELRREGIQAELKVGNIKMLPFPDATFDVVVATEVLEHLDDRTVRAGIKEISRVLKKGGVFMGTVPAQEDLKTSLVYCPKCGNVFHRWGHLQRFSAKRLERLFSSSIWRKRSFTIFTNYWELPPRQSVSLNFLKYLLRLVIFHSSRRFIGIANYWYLIIVQK